MAADQEETAAVVASKGVTAGEASPSTLQVGRTRL
jgi:hypothetical protein